MKAAADAEEQDEKHPVTPVRPRPARELLGAMLLERGSTGEALAAFEATLKKEPNRFNAYAGAAQAADRLGDKAKATAYYEKVAALGKSRMPTDRPSARKTVLGEELRLVNPERGCPAARTPGTRE